MIRILIALLFTPPAALAGFGPYTGDVTRTVDGDTLDAVVHVWPGQTNNARIRVDIIDTPELRSKSKCERALAKKAKTFTEQFVSDGPISITISSKDAFGRYLATVKANGKDLATALTNAGLARKYKRNDHEPWCKDK